MGAIGDALAEAIRARAVSAALGVYGIFWAAFHWQGLYVTFFVSEESIYNQHKLLKNEYIDKYFFGWNGWNDWVYYAGLVLPAVFTLVFLTLFTKHVLNWFYGIEQENKIERRIKKLFAEKRLLKAREDSANQEKETFDAQKEAAQAAKSAEAEDPQILWEREFNEFRKDPAFDGFQQIIESVYEFGGYVKYGDRFSISSGNLAIADSNGLVDIDNSSRTPKISLTEKGKYFVKHFPLGR